MSTVVYPAEIRARVRPAVDLRVVARDAVAIRAALRS
jgi:hypothetical protein